MLALCAAKAKMDAYVIVAKTLVLHSTDKHWLLKLAQVKSGEAFFPVTKRLWMGQRKAFITATVTLSAVFLL